MAYFCYVSGEMLGESGIVALFACGFTMAHYMLPSLSPSSQKHSQIIISTLSFAIEGFLFVYLGISVLSIHSNFFMLFSVYVLIACVISRVVAIGVSVGILLAVKKLFCRCAFEQKGISLSFKEICVIMLSG
jgi:NhaP-type Na+/H+ or K+/H+ antiporter